jgi:hypothetical protein
MLYIPTLISIIEVLLVTVPALLTIAFVTVAERKTMASMQRRLGPNIVGQLKPNLSFKRSYHSSCYDKNIDTLYKNRKSPIKGTLSKKVLCVSVEI